MVVGAWLALDDDRLESARTLLAAALPAAIVVGIAFALPGVTGDGESSHTRWRDGLIFGALLIVGAIAATMLRRVPLPRVPRRVLLGVGAAVIVALVAVAVVRGGGSGAIGNSGGRLADTSSNFRFTWWGQAVRGWEHDKLLGTGAGTFHVTNLRYRDSYLDYTTEPHNLPLQFLTEAGVVGLALFLLAAAALLRGSYRRRNHELALALLLPAYLVHSLVDIDWDFVAVSAPAFLAAGALAGRAAVRRVSPFASLAAAGVALFAFVVLLLPWLGERWSAEATVAPPARAVKLAERARSVDPLLVEPLWALAFAAELRGDLPTAFALLRRGDAQAAEERRHLAVRGPVRVHARLHARGLRQPREVHGARQQGPAEPRRRCLQRRAEDRQQRQGEVLEAASGRRARSPVAHRARLTAPARRVGRRS